MSAWQLRPVPFKLQLSDFTLCSFSIPLQVRAIRLVDDVPESQSPTPPADALLTGSQGFAIRGMPILSQSSKIQRCGDYLCYVPQQYHHCYIDLSIGFDGYQSKFSSKTRSTILRKIRKYAEHCGGTITWKTYRSPQEIEEFFPLAIALSKLTYQERLLDAGLPGTDEYRLRAISLAEKNQVRAYMLFDGTRPVSYLFCPVEDGVLSYSFLGYDPEYMHHSVGTVLQWLALEQIFNEGCFRYFDFTEGQSDHKRMFATNQRLRANVFFLKRNVRNWIVIYAHWLIDRLSVALGTSMERLGIKSRVKRLLRFAR